MSDFYCDTCDGKLEFRLFPDGQIATLCERCYPEWWSITAPDEQRYYNLTYDGSGDRDFIYNPFKCPSCDSVVEKITQKTRKCHSCGYTYPIYD